jgi:hypothetical protein
MGRAVMGALRNFLRDHRRPTALLIALALAMKVLVPSGYMISQKELHFTVEVCSAGSGQHQHLTQQLTIPVDGKSGDSPSEHSKSECPYSALSMASLGAADPLQLAIALVFILALGFAAVPPLRTRRIPHLRPPLRGPPALA